MPPLPKLLKAVACLLFLCQQGQAQDFIIVHDLQKDTTNFFKIGKTRDTLSVKEIGFRKPGRITLKVENFNPFYYNAKVTAFKKPVDEESGQIGMFIGGLTKQLGIAGFPTSRGSGDIEEQKKLKQLYGQLEEAGLQLTDLKYNIKEPAPVIKSEALAIGSSVMNLTGKKSLDPKEMRLAGNELDTRVDMPMETPFAELLSLISKTYNEIINTSYRFSYSIKGSTDINELKLQIYPRSDSIARENSRDTITKYFTLRDKSNLRIRNAVGISFTYFQDKNKSYYVKPDYTIGSGTADLFIPVVSTYLHFYSNKSSGFKWGGSFGFGIPLVGDKKDVNYMLGLCSIFGRNEAIIISVGFAGTRVERLTDGWKVGQTVPSLGFNIPTLNQFRAGGFLSITFNLKSTAASRNDD